MVVEEFVKHVEKKKTELQRTIIQAVDKFIKETGFNVQEIEVIMFKVMKQL